MIPINRIAAIPVIQDQTTVCVLLRKLGLSSVEFIFYLECKPKPANEISPVTSSVSADSAESDESLSASSSSEEEATNQANTAKPTKLDLSLLKRTK